MRNPTEDTETRHTICNLLEDLGYQGFDASLEVSLYEHNFVFKCAGMGTYTVILWCDKGFPGGPGYKIEVLDKHSILDPRNEHIPLPHYCNNLHDMCNMKDAVLLRHTIKHGDFFYPSHYFDKPHDSTEFISLLEDTLSSND